MMAPATAQDAPPEIASRKYVAPEAEEGVVVDAKHFYALDHRRIVKYDKKSGARVAEWKDVDGGPIRHFSGGVVVGKLLYASHVTHPELPAASSIEIFDTRSMKHVGTRSFGVVDGQIKWIDRYDGAWWLCLGYYDRHKGIDPVKGSRYTQIVKYNDQWQQQGAWLLDPKLVEAKLVPNSASGGSFGPDGRLYIAAKRGAEIHALSFPKAGSTMIWEGSYAVDIQGQQFSWDRSNPGMVYGARPKDKLVTATDLSGQIKPKR
jgi:hypothetical protein